MTNYTSTKSANGYQVRLSITTKSQNPSTNKSVLNWSIAVINPSNHYAIARMSGNVIIGGTTVWSISGVTHNTGPAGTTKTIASGTREITHASDGTASVKVSGTLRTDTQGQGWSIPPLTASGTYKPASLAKPPGKPAAPSVSKNSSTRVITVTAAVPSSSSPITGHQIRWRVDNSGGTSYGDWTNVTADSNRRITLTPNSPYSRYQFQSRAKTVAGYGDFSGSTGYLNQDPTVKVRSGGSWKNAIAYVKVGGVWKGALAYVKDGSWKRTGV